jgi:hypothetical protein
MVLGAFLFSGCDKFNDERFSTTIIKDFEVNITDNGGAIDISLDSTLTAMINDELEAVKDDIEKYELVQIKYKIWEYIGDPAATFVGSLGIGNINSTMPGVSYEFNDISLKSGNDDPNSVLMSFNSSEIDKIEQYFLDTNGLKIFLEGNVSHVPVSFILQVVVDVDAIANVKK